MKDTNPELYIIVVWKNELLHFYMLNAKIELNNNCFILSDNQHPIYYKMLVLFLHVCLDILAYSFNFILYQYDTNCTAQTAPMQSLQQAKSSDIRSR